jgi:hypothetical protein
MSRRTAGLGLGMLLFITGCGSVKPGGLGVRNDRPIDAPPPDAPRLVAYLNDNARRVQAVECDKVSIDCKQGDQSIGLDGLMACQKPRSFRLKLKALSKPGADIGSTDQEFWFWISKTEPIPYVFHCSYQDLARTNVEMPFPFQPDMIMSALGIAEYDPNKKYEVKPNGNTLELIEQATSPAGQPITRLTVFQRQAVPVGKPQVIAHVIRDARGQDVCVATVQEVAIDRTTGAILPQRVKIVWPGKTQAEKAEMTMRFYDMHATSFDVARAARLFSRQDLAGQQSYDLARQAPDAPGGVSQTQAVDIGTPRK